MLATLPKSVTNALNIVRPPPMPLQVMEIEEDGNVVMRPASQRAQTTSYSNWSLLFSAVRWAKHRLGMKRYSFEKKDTIYVRTTLKERKSAKSQLERRAVAGSHDR